MAIAPSALPKSRALTYELDLVAGLKQTATMTIADIKQSAFANGNVKLVPRLPTGPSLYECLGTIHDIDSLQNIERELREDR